MKKRTIAIFLLALVLLMISCTLGGAPPPPEERKYFEGIKGIDIGFADKGNPPAKLYYYSDTPDNRFHVNVRVANTGSSFARGGIYLSGYDPNMIQVFGINPNTLARGTCGISIGNIGFGTFGGIFQCDNDITFGIDRRGDFEVNLQNIFSKFGLTNSLFGDGDLQVSCQPGDSGQGISGDCRFGFQGGDKFAINIDYGTRGRLLIGLFSGISFQRNFGTEYLLAGNIPEFPGGDIAYVDFDANIANWPQGLDQVNQDFLITNCYIYTTHAAPIVCIDPAPFSDATKVCIPKPYVGTKGQGTPVVVTKIDQENTPRQARFTIHVKNQGKGEVWDIGRIEKCSPYAPQRTTESDKNIVWIGDVRVSGDPRRLKCSPNDFIRLDAKGQGEITCAYDIPFGPVKSAYQTPFVVELWYGYSNTAKKTVLIKRAI